MRRRWESIADVSKHRTVVIFSSPKNVAAWLNMKATIIVRNVANTRPTTHHNIPEEFNPQQRRCVNLRSCKHKQ